MIEQKSTTNSFPYAFAFESFGVRIAVRVSSAAALEMIEQTARAAIAGPVKEIDERSAKHVFLYTWRRLGTDSLIPGQDDPIADIERPLMLEILRAKLRLTVAEFAPKHVFIHAGVVGWRDKAIVLPGKSFSGKTTLTRELIRLGAEYYSDEYAVIDSSGCVRPFPKPLSIRMPKNPCVQVDFAPETVAAKVGRKRIPIGLVVASRFKEGSHWLSRELTAANGILTLLENAVGVRTFPERYLSTLNTVANSARFISATRGEAVSAAKHILRLMES